MAAAPERVPWGELCAVMLRSALSISTDLVGIRRLWSGSGRGVGAGWPASFHVKRGVLQELCRVSWTVCGGFVECGAGPEPPGCLGCKIYGEAHHGTFGWHCWQAGVAAGNAAGADGLRAAVLASGSGMC